MLENMPVNSSAKRYSATPISRLRLDLTRETSTRLHIKISDPEKSRYEIPEKCVFFLNILRLGVLYTLHLNFFICMLTLGQNTARAISSC